MTLSKNEQIGMYVIVFLVVVVAGFFIFVKPERDLIPGNKATLAAKEAEFDEKERRLGDPAFNRIGQDIVDAYKDGAGAALDFYNQEFLDFEADRLIQGILKDITNPLNADEPYEFLLDNLDVNRLSTGPLSLTLYKPTIINYPIKDKARVSVGASTITEDGRMSLDDMKRMMAAASRNQALDYYETNRKDPAIAGDVVVAMREFLALHPEVVATQIVSFDVPLNQAEQYALSMHVFEMEKATHIRTITAEKEVVEGDTAGRTMHKVMMVFHIVEPMEEPNDEPFTYLKFPVA